MASGRVPITTRQLASGAEARSLLFTVTSWWNRGALSGTRTPAGRRRPAALPPPRRGYGEDVATPPTETQALRSAYVAAREIMRARTVEEAQQAVLTLCRALGARHTDDLEGHPGAIPLDLALDDRGPVLPVSDDPAVTTLLTRYLVPAVADARLVAQRSLSSERLVTEATQDPLTGLWNRRSIEFAINRAEAGDCIAMIDIDHFKRVNDNGGHDAGDAVLVTFASYLRGAVRSQDIVGRLGGEEFVIVLPDTRLVEACTTLRRVHQRWQDMAIIHVTFSVGVAPVEADFRSPETPGQLALKAADALMYRVKATGRNRVACAGR